MRLTFTSRGIFALLMWAWFSTISLFAVGAATVADVDREVSRGRTLLLSAPDQALAASDVAHRIGQTLPASKSRVLALASADWLRAASLLSLHRADEAHQVIDRALAGDIARVAPDSVQYADLLIARAVAQRTGGNVEQALGDSLKAYRIYQATGQARSQALALSSIGSIYLVARDYPNALRYYAQSMEAFGGDPSLTVTAFGNRGVAFKELGRYAAAEREFNRALVIARRQSSPIFEARILGYLADTQLTAGQTDDAQRSVQRGLSILQNAPAGDWTASLWGVAAELAERRGDHVRAGALIDQIFAGRDLASTTIEMRPFLDTGYRAFKGLGEQAKALRYLEAYKTVDDRARSLAASANAALMSARFDFAYQQTRIAQLRANEVRQQATIEQARARTRGIILGGLLVATFIVSSLLLFGFVSIRRSRDRERAANEELSRTNTELADALAARTEFLAMTSHEIRTPLNGILGMTQVLLADRAIDAPVRERIQLVHGAGQTMKALVDDILDIAKMTSGEIRIERAPMDLRTLLRDTSRVWEDQAATKGIAVVLDADAAPERIVEDEVRLRQIVFNLMSNAVKFTDRGEVRLTVTIVEAADPDAAPRLRIAVRDTGIGIPPEKLEEVFESFRQVDGGTTRRHGGTGLGLAICRNLARAMGGDVTVESVLGAGATFLLDLPVDEIAPVAAATPQPGGAHNLAASRLLLLEANPLSQSVLKAVLTPHVAALEIVPEPATAMASLAAGNADLVLADAGALGLDMDVAAQLAEAAKSAGARVALLWPSPDKAMGEKAVAAGVALLIAKPINAAELIAKLKSLDSGDVSRSEIAA